MKSSTDKKLLGTTSIKEDQMTDLIETIKDTAAENDTPQYKAAMLEYLKASKEENKAKAKKEKLKAVIVKTLEKIGKKVEATQVPNSDQYAVAFPYDQPQPFFDKEKAAKLLTAEQLAEIYYTKTAHCFTVRAMSETAMEAKLVENGVTPSK